MDENNYVLFYPKGRPENADVRFSEGLTKKEASERLGKYKDGPIAMLSVVRIKGTEGNEFADFWTKQMEEEVLAEARTQPEGEKSPSSLVSPTEDSGQEGE